MTGTRRRPEEGGTGPGRPGGLALLDGGPLPAPPVGTLGAALRRAAHTGQGVVLVDAGGAATRRSYAELYEDAARVLSGLRAAGVRPGAVVLLRPAAPGDLLTAFWACVLGGLVPLPVPADGGPGAPGVGTPGVGTPGPGPLGRSTPGSSAPGGGPPGRGTPGTGPLGRSTTSTSTPGSSAPGGGPLAAGPLGDALRAVGEAWLISDDVSGPAPAGLRPLGPVAGLRARSADRAPHPARPDDPAVLTLTSGSSGRPKAVPLTHRNILSRSHATALARGLDGTTRTLNWLPLDHVSGLVMFHVRDVFLGCHQVHADTGWVRADLLRWLDLASAERIDTTWAPNHAFALVTERLVTERPVTERLGTERPVTERLAAQQPPAGDPAGRRWDLSALRYIMNGGEAVKDRVARRFLAALAPYGLPPTAVHPGWGMPETASGVVDAVFDPRGGPPRRYVPVGAPHPGVSLRVVDEDGRVLPERVVGRLQVTGPTVAGTYLEGGVRRPAPLTSDGWLVTDDLAFVDGGELTVTGRADDVIEVGGDRYHGHEIEEAIDELPCVVPSFTVVRGFPGTAGDRALAVFFRPRPDVPVPEAERLVRERVRLRFGAAVDHLEALAADELPRTATGKLRRSALTARLPG